MTAAYCVKYGDKAQGIILTFLLHHIREFSRHILSSNCVQADLYSARTVYRQTCTRKDCVHVDLCLGGTEAVYMYTSQCINRFSS